MRIFIQFSFLFAEILLAVVELVVGALILREFLRRRNQPHLFYMAISLILMGLGNVSGFTGDFLYSYGAENYALIFTAIFSNIILLGSFFFACGIVNLYATRKKLWYALTAILAVAFLLFGRVGVGEAFGQIIPAESVSQFMSAYGYWILVHFVASMVIFKAYAKSRHNKQPCGEADRMLFIGSGMSMFSAIIAIGFLSVQATQFTALVYLVLIIGSAYKYLGAVAIKHPDKQIQTKPGQAVSGFMTAKVLIACGLFFVIFSFALVATVTQYFVRGSIDKQHKFIKHTLQHAAAEQIRQQQTLRTVSEMLASHHGSLQALNGDGSALIELISFVREDKNVDIDLVDENGSVIASSYSRDIGENFYARDIAVVASALEGKTSVSIDMLRGPNMWSNISASPIFDDSSQVRGALVISQQLIARNFTQCLSEFGAEISGCGLISSRDEQIYSSGQSVDALAINRFRKLIQIGGSFGEADDDELGKYFVSSYGDDLGEDEFYYAFTADEDRDAVLLRIMSTVVLITFLFFAAFSFLLIFGTSLFLKPIMILRQAAVRLSRGEFDQVLERSSADEIGQLTQAFNDMTATIRKQTRSLNEKIREQRDALSHTAHEIRIPLNIFRWSLEMLRFGEVGPLNNEQMELVEQMSQTNNRIRKLVNELLEVSRLEQGGVSLELADVQIENLIDETAGSFSVLFRQKKIDFYWHRPDNQLPPVRIDRERIIQVLNNLFSNAAKFTNEEGHVEISVKEQPVSGPSGQKGRFIRVTVKDNGQGIPKNEQKNIFSKFYRAANVVKAEIQGTGLGLYLSKKYVEMHGGEIWFESKESEGTSFHITLPVSD